MSVYADPERPWGSVRPEWLVARDTGRLDSDGNIRETSATEAGEG